MHLVNNTFDVYSNSCINKELSKHFGVFIGKSNPPRLYLNSYLHGMYLKLTIQSYRYNIEDDYYRNNIGLETLITDYGIVNVETESSFLSKSPILLDSNTRYSYIKELPTNLSQQLDKTNSIIDYYKKFFVEIVCETYYSGNTFFPTEKTWRPMLLKTPFIVQGPTNFLKNLRKLGFKTFDKWWDEGYDEDAPNHSIHEIQKVIDFLSNKSLQEIQHMHNEMHNVLEHNYNTLIRLHSTHE